MVDTSFLKKEVFKVDGITLTVLSVILIALVVYFFFLKKK